MPRDNELQVIDHKRPEGLAARPSLRENGAVVPNAGVTLTAKEGQTKTVTASRDGSYSFGNLLARQYVVQVSAPKLEGRPGSITALVRGRPRRLHEAFEARALGRV